MSTIGLRRPALSFSLTGWDRRARILFGGLAIFTVAVNLAVWAYRFATIDESARWGGDYRPLMDAGSRWLAGGPFYPPAQVAAPFDAFTAGVLYPPFAIPFFAAATFLPWVLWWAVPLTIGVAGVVRLHPAPWTWPVIAAGALFDNSVWLVLSGNPIMWGFAGLAWFGLSWSTLYFVLKPSLGPLAFLGVRHRSWWIGLAALAALGLVFLPLWDDWLAVVRNAQSGRGVLYSIFDLPLLAIPLVAWAGRSRARGLAD